MLLTEKMNLDSSAKKRLDLLWFKIFSWGDRQLLSARTLGSDQTHQIFRWSSDQNAVLLLSPTRDNKSQ